MIKLIAIDLDGTLLADDKTLSEGNLKAIRYAQEQNVKVVICTGRPFLAMNHLVQEIGFTSDDDYIVIFNGAQVRQAKDGRKVVSNDLSKTDMMKWYEETNRLNLPLNVIDDNLVYEPLSYPEGHESFYVTRVTTAPSQVTDYYRFDDDHTFNKLVITIEEDYLEQQIALINPQLKEDYSLARSHPYQLEIMKKGVDKGTALVQLGQHLNIHPSEMMTLGDQGNDITMIDVAGLGIAMGNASDEIKQLADDITLDNNSDGVAEAIYKYIK